MKTVLVSIALLTLSLGAAAEEAQYKVTFKGNFSASMQPHRNFPGNPHFSQLVVAGHNKKYDMFGLGKKSTPGVKDVAETGSSNKLVAELKVQRNRGSVLEFRRTSSGFTGLETMALNVRVDRANPFISAITMIAPSPDWVVGVSKYSVLKAGRFLEKKVIPLYAIDAGTDSGRNYTSSNSPTKPQAKIHKLRSVNGEGTQAPYGYLTIEKL
jgi:hypothetical protein